MANPKKVAVIDARVARAFLLRQEIADKQADLKKVEEELIAVGAGPYVDAEGHTCTVVGQTFGTAGKVTYELPEDGEAKARELAGEKFGKLFKRTVLFSPIEGFAQVVPTHLTPAAARDLVDFCAVQGKGSSPKSAYILWPK